ncbi:hypothetical protein J2Y45_003184 [Dyadobacter sp. BE34]|uniref:Uncharacterized protein n=1 Tax=Dyadobacter fermentans TaxID=94254 RepID=A0ABU1QXV7_9BACT|nr:hypothetical protein [Dyadobacter fermentans]MDR7043732.1 hypothetical protein [Dyadobacter sp. BE242]MDR7198044.1 hypothetical protein [Dyadobacter sp. BE34]MDR7216006.1 hypothetical protein [Dyadobacter sp. BE31]MDR7264468.1 hypothetical protein [Dyadobacter sp. BE32]
MNAAKIAFLTEQMPVNCCKLSKNDYDMFISGVTCYFSFLGN